MRPDILLISEMIDAAEQARQLAAGVSATELERDRQRRDALLWNFTVLGEAAARLSGDTQERFPDVQWQQPARLQRRSARGARFMRLTESASRRSAQGRSQTGPQRQGDLCPAQLLPAQERAASRRNVALITRPVSSARTAARTD
jgi:uncharacterized protein with HEPN domain